LLPGGLLVMDIAARPFDRLQAMVGIDQPGQRWSDPEDPGVTIEHVCRLEYADTDTRTCVYRLVYRRHGQQGRFEEEQDTMTMTFPTTEAVLEVARAVGFEVESTCDSFGDRATYEDSTEVIFHLRRPG